jgi:putative ABC transport system permease protein
MNLRSGKSFGVIGDVLHSGLDTTARPEMFVPYWQSPTPQMTFVVKTTPDAAAMLPAVKSRFVEVQREPDLLQTATMEQLVSESLKQRRFNLFLLVSFATIALLLAGLAFTDQSTIQPDIRTHEIGLRMALGAQSARRAALDCRSWIGPIAYWIAIGLIASFVLTRLMKGLLFGISATDPVTFVAISLLLTSIGLLASWVPARRPRKSILTW